MMRGCRGQHIACNLSRSNYGTPQSADSLIIDTPNVFEKIREGLGWTDVSEQATGNALSVTHRPLLLYLT